MNKTFKVDSGKICISDPCYTRGTWCGHFDLPAKNGQWETEIEISDEMVNWGKRVKSLTAYCDSEIKVYEWQKLSFVGVDSGQMGIFCSSIYPTDKNSTGEYGDKSTFYGKACLATCDHDFPTKRFDIVLSKGVCSSSGFGDGEYSVACQKNEMGEIVAVKIVFINDGEEEELD